MSFSPDELLDRFYNYLTVERRLAANTLESYGRDLKQFFAFLDSKKSKTVLGCTRSDLLLFLNAEKKRGLSSRSLARMLSCIKSFYKFIVQDGLLPCNPLHNIEGPRMEKKLPHILSTSEIETLINAPDIKTALGIRDRAFFYA